MRADSCTCCQTHNRRACTCVTRLATGVALFPWAGLHGTYVHKQSWVCRWAAGVRILAGACASSAALSFRSCEAGVISRETLPALAHADAVACLQGPHAGAQHAGQAQARQTLLARIEELLRGAGGPVCDAYVADIEHVVDQNPIAVPPWSTVATRTRFGFAELQI